MSDFRERLKNRYHQFRQNLEEQEQPQPSKRPNVGRGTVTAFGRSNNGFTSARSARKERQRFGSSEEEEEEVEIVKPSNSGTRFSSSSGSRFSSRFRERNNNRVRNNKNNGGDLDVQASSQKERFVPSESSFGARRRTSNSNRFRNRISANRRKPAATSKPSFKRPSSPSISTTSETTSKPKFTFKKFDRFKRPDLRQSLLQKILNKGKTNVLSPEEQEEQRRKKEEEEKAASEAAEATEDDLAIEDEEDIYEDEDSLQDLGKEKDSRLQTTLLVSTVFPDHDLSSFLEVATIRSPYSFGVGDSSSTRYITVTRTFTGSVRPSRTEPPPQSSSTPVFQACNNYQTFDPWG